MASTVRPFEPSEELLGTLTKIENCVTCAKGKQSRKPFPNEVARATKLLELIHTDLCGPMSVSSLGGAKYYISFVDDYSRKVFVYPIRTKSQALNKFIVFETLVEKQTGLKIKMVRSDNGYEYCSQRFIEYLSKNGITHQKSSPYTPQQDGVTERMNRTHTFHGYKNWCSNCQSRELLQMKENPLIVIYSKTCF